MKADSLKAVCSRAAERLRLAHFARPEVEARLLIALSLKMKPEDIIAQDDRLLSPEEIISIEKVLSRREALEPFAYLQGFKEFFGRNFFVNPDVLIPRPETEDLLERILKWVSQNNFESGLIIDLGTGTGCIGITLGLELGPAWKIVGLDRSSAALQIAERNAKALNLESIEFRQVDMLNDRMSIQRILTEFPEGPVVLVSNPPYIASEEISDLQVDVRDYEPRLALDGGPEGMDFYRSLAFWTHQSWDRSLLWAVETGGTEQIQKIRGLLGPEGGSFEHGPHLFFERLEGDR